MSIENTPVQEVASSLAIVMPVSLSVLSQHSRQAIPREEVVVVVLAAYQDLVVPLPVEATKQSRMTEEDLWESDGHPGHLDASRRPSR